MIQEALEVAVQEGARQLLTDYNARDFNTFGALRDSIRAEGNRIVAKGYIFNLIRGQKPMEKYIPYGEDTPLYRWADKKITTQNVKSVAFLISRKLKNEGDRIFRNEREPLDIDTAKAVTISVFGENLKDRFRIKIKKANELP